MHIRDVLFILVAIIAVSALVMSSINTVRREKFDAPRLLAMGQNDVPTFAAYEFDGLESDKAFKTVTEGGAGKLNLDAHIASEITSRFPIGTIVLWANNAQPPAGWVNCDGGTHNRYRVPNLKEKFVRGATSIESNTGDGYTSGGGYSVTLKPKMIPNHGHRILGFGGQNTVSGNEFSLDGAVIGSRDSRILGSTGLLADGNSGCVAATAVGQTTGLLEYDPSVPGGIDSNGRPCNRNRANSANFTKTNNLRGTDITNEQEAVKIPEPEYVDLRYICYVGT